MDNKKYSMNAPHGAGSTISNSRLQARVVFATLTNSIPKTVRWSFFLFVATLPFETLSLPYISSGTWSLSRLCGMVLFISYILHAGLPFKLNLPPVPRQLWWFGGYFLIYVSTGLSLGDESLSAYVVRIMTLVQLFVLVWIAYDLLRNLNFAKNCLVVFALSCAFVAIGTLLNIPGFSVVSGERTTAMNFNPNEIAALMAYAAIVLIGFCLIESRWSAGRKLILGFLVMPLMVLMVSTGSRSAIGAFVIGMLWFFIPQLKSKRKIVAVGLAFAVLAGFLYVVWRDPATSERLERSIQEGETAGRQVIYQEAMGMISENPMFGWGGRDAFTELGNRLGRGGRGMDAHNLILYLLIEVGLVGTIPFLTAVWLCVRDAWRGRKSHLGYLCLALLTTALAHNMAHSGIRIKFFWLILGLSIAGAAAARRKIKVRVISAAPVLGSSAVQNRAMRFGPVNQQDR